MCLYSVRRENTRLGEKGDRLVPQRFHYGITGLVSPAHGHLVTCLKDGTCLTARNVPLNLQERYRIGPEAEVAFVHGNQIPTEGGIEPDAFRLKSGRLINIDEFPSNTEFEVISVPITLPAKPARLAEAEEDLGMPELVAAAR